MSKEKVIENLILEYLGYRGIVAWKNNSTGVYDPVKKTYRKNMNKYVRNGVADILGILPDGRFLAIEVKAPKGRVSKEQEQFINTINEHNGLAFVARDLQIVVDKLKEYKEHEE